MRGLTIAQLAAASGISGSRISRLECETRDASLETVRALASSLHVTADHLELGVADEVVARVTVGRVDAAADQFGVPLCWYDLDAVERDRVLAGLDDALLDTVVARMYAAYQARSR